MARRRPAAAAALKSGIDPGAGDDLRAVQRADVLLVLADPLVDGFGREQPLLDQQRLQRLGPQRHVGFLLRIVGHRPHPSLTGSANRCASASLSPERAPDSFPTDRARPSGAARRNPPRARGRRSGRCRAAAGCSPSPWALVSGKICGPCRRCTISPACRVRSAAAGCARADGRCASSRRRPPQSATRRWRRQRSRLALRRVARTATPRGSVGLGMLTKVLRPGVQLVARSGSHSRSGCARARPASARKYDARR